MSIPLATLFCFLTFCSGPCDVPRKGHVVCGGCLLRHKTLANVVQVDFMAKIHAFLVLAGFRFLSSP